MNASESEEIRRLREENQRLRQEVVRLQTAGSDNAPAGSLSPRSEEALLDLAHVLIRDSESRIIFWNRGAELLYGWTKAEALGQVSHTLLQTVFPVSLEATQDALWNKGEWEGELRHACRDGTQILVASHQVLHHDAQGRPIAILEINNDITRSRRTEQTLQQLQRQTAERATVLEAANHVALDILTSQTGVEALRHIAEAARKLTQARYAALGVARLDGEGLLAFVTVGLTPEEEARIGPRPQGQGLLGLLLQRSEPLRVDTLAEHPASSGFPPDHPPMNSFLGVPIRRGHTILGSLYLTNKETGEAFTEADEVAVEALGAYAAVAIHNWHLLSRPPIPGRRTARKRQMNETTQRELSVLLVDDHTIWRGGVRSMLDDSEFVIVGEAASGQEALEVARRTQPRLTLLDIRMVGGDGLETLVALKQEHPRMAVVMLTTYDNPRFMARAVAGGAAGYLLKGVGREEMLTALRAVANGETLLSAQDLVRSLRSVSEEAARSDAPNELLTSREQEVLRLLATGLSNLDIAAVLSLSASTIKTDIEHLLGKLGVSDRTQAAVWAAQHGLAPLAGR